MKRPHDVQHAFDSLSLACGELSKHRRKGNFFASTLRKNDEQDEAICDNVRTLAEYIEELETENAHLRGELRVSSGDDVDDSGTIAQLSECTGTCAAELSRDVPMPRLRAMAEEHGILFDESEVKAEAAEILRLKGQGRECSVCINGENHHE